MHVIMWGIWDILDASPWEVPEESAVADSHASDSEVLHVCDASVRAWGIVKLVTIANQEFLPMAG